MNNSNKTGRIWAAVLFVYTVALFSLAVIDTGGTGAAFHGADKLIHFGEFALLGWLAVRMTHAARANTRPGVIWMFCAGYGVMLEFVQIYIPWRSFEWLDILANAFGSAAGIYLAIAASRRFGIGQAEKTR